MDRRAYVIPGHVAKEFHALPQKHMHVCVYYLFDHNSKDTDAA